MTIFGFDFKELIVRYGIWFVVGVVFAESCLVFFLPGDSFIFVAGLLASQHILSLWQLIILGLLAGVLGNSLGYYLGRQFGELLFRPGSRLFKPDHLAKTHQFYDRHGPVTIVLARFVPVVRTFAPIVAGIGTMRYPVFLLFNIIGAALWVAGMALAGYWLGATVPNIDKYILPIIALIIFLSVLPALIAIWRKK